MSEFDSKEVTPDIILEALNPVQQQAVKSTSPFLRIVAGAGSGKTRVLVHRMAWLVANGMFPSQLLAVTFTNKAANEMRHRLESLIGPSARKMWVGTFHGLSYRILRQHHEHAQLDANFQILDAEDQLRLIKGILKAQNIDPEECDPKSCLGFINRAKDEGQRSAALMGQSYGIKQRYAQVYQWYEQHCERAHLVDFAELLLRVVQLWKSSPDVLGAYSERFLHLLVDEFQDTNSIQYEWLALLAQKGAHVTVVGDDDQSIYGWRGAKIENIHRFAKEFPNTQTIRLEQNYRSTETILKAANTLIGQNEGRLGKSLWTQHTQGDLIECYAAFNEIDEARYIAQRINQFVAQGDAYSDCALLYRSNAQSRVLEQALRQAQYPYVIYGGVKFFERAEIKDMLSYLRLLVNVRDDPAFERVINLPPRGIGEKSIRQIKELAKQQTLSYWEAAKLFLTQSGTSRLSKGLNDFFGIIESWVPKMSEMSLPDLVDKLLQRSGLLHYYANQSRDRNQLRVENLQEFLTAAQEFHDALCEQKEQSQMCAHLSLPLFLSEVALDAGERASSAQMDAVKLMTLHSAKGLEFKNVFLCGLEEGLFPHHRTLQAKEQLEEERRLCYVGITRAMSHLCLSFAQKRAFAGRTGTNHPSRFIKELPPQLIEMVNLNLNLNSSPNKASTKLFHDKEENHPFQLGQRVLHPKFGQGMVLALEGAGEMARVQVNFDTHGTKWLVLAYAKLEALESTL